VKFLSKLIFSGLIPEDNGLTVIRITIANLIIILTSVLILFYIFLFLKIGYIYPTLAFALFVVAAGYCYCLLRKRKFKSGLFLVQILACYMITASMVTFGWRSNGHVFLPIAMIFIFILFDDEKTWIPQILILIACFVGSFIYLDINGPMIIDIPLKYDYYLNMAFAITSCGVLSYVVMKSFRNYVREREIVFSNMATSNKLLEEKNIIIARQKDELELFNSMASHDLKGSIRTISSFADLIRRRTTDDQSLEYLGFIKSGANQLTHLVEGITYYQQIEKSNRQTGFIDPNTILKEIIDIINPQKGSIYEITFSELPLLKMNGVHFHHIIQNLIQNGLKYNKRAPKKVHVSYKKTDDHFIINIEDNGIGIDPQYFDYIFEPFKRLNSPNEYESSGLGLAIVKKTVELYGGQIEVFSQNGNGSQFKLVFDKSILLT